MRLSANKLKVGFILFSLLVASFSFAATVPAQATYYPNPMCKLSVSAKSPVTGLITGGYVLPSGQNMLYYYGQQVTLQAYTHQGYVFDGWYLDGFYQGKLSTITLTMTQDYTLYAVFSQRISILTINSNPASGGYTTPESGMWNHTYGSSVPVTAYPAKGNSFCGWYLDGVFKGNSTTISVTMDSDHQLSAFFAGSGALPTPQPTSLSTPPPQLLPTPNPNLPTPTLSFYCLCSTKTSVFNVHIQGALAYNQTSISGANVRFSYSATGGATWHDLASVVTGDDGNFSVVWMPQASGNYIVKGTCVGDGVYQSVETTVNLAVAPDQQDQMFSVASNSTLSSLVFNSEANRLLFSVTGPSNTYGYLEACIPKTLLPDIQTLAVNVDGILTPYTVLSDGNMWLVILMYHHSSHSVVFALNSPTPTSHP